MNFQEIRTTEDQFQLATYAKMDIAVERGSGVWVWTSDGDKYLDLYGGHAVCATGHSHPHVVRAIQEQAEKVLFYSNLVYSEIRAKAAEKLVSIAPDKLTKAFFCNSGTEEFGNIDSVRAVADRETAAIILEPIQSMAGVREASPAFFSELRQICDDLGIVLIFDEVQTGVGRTGNWFIAGSEHADGAVPDIITLAKSLGSGVPVGACLVKDSVAAHIKTNDLGTTFGGGMLAMAAVLATLEAIEDDDMIANSVSIEQHLRASLSGVTGVMAVHGKGCLLGIEFDEACGPVHKKLLSQKIITGTSSDPNVLRLLPPLMVSTDEIDMLVEVLKS
ncbi:MAG: aminotransferase class III-fold pyridoxal phosphate-dependent enzyme [Chloracidobacterium sp.]|nr:aminotransferase class III-fold pyridoxal phosphate-dependent enzyme [Chloracidobacterium sp.]